MTICFIIIWIKRKEYNWNVVNLIYKLCLACIISIRSVEIGGTRCIFFTKFNFKIYIYRCIHIYTYILGYIKSTTRKKLEIRINNELEIIELELFNFTHNCIFANHIYYPEYDISITPFDLEIYFLDFD